MGRNRLVHPRTLSSRAGGPEAIADRHGSQRKKAWLLQHEKVQHFQEIKNRRKEDVKNIYQILQNVQLVRSKNELDQLGLECQDGTS